MKTATSNLINDRKWFRARFHWQEEFGAFSYSPSQLNRVIQYIKDQEKHHAKTSFWEEYLEFLKRFGVEHDERYIFRFESNTNVVINVHNRAAGRADGPSSAAVNAEH